MPTGEAQSPRVLADFEGLWRVARLIAPRDGPQARFDGRAKWAADGGTLIYTEAGEMVLDGQVPMQAQRRYVWHPDLSVHFDDGRFFHRVPALGGTTEHWCDPDSYKLTYDFGNWPRFSVLWQVKGPRKDYRATTEYRRC